jgi:hypothetical protein
MGAEDGKGNGGLGVPLLITAVIAATLLLGS